MGSGNAGIDRTGLAGEERAQTCWAMVPRIRCQRIAALTRLGKNVEPNQQVQATLYRAPAPASFDERRKGMKRKRVLMSICTALIVLVTGCESNNGNSTNNGTVLAGTEWRLSAWSASSLDPSRFTITADFDESRISGTSAVNSYGGVYSTTASGNFSVGELQSTMMGGSDDAMRAESMYFELLRRVRRFTVNQTTLTLFDEGNNVSLIFTRR
ncbi:MAG: META domain-containing protein [Candidatus Atribacteria bacterium]|nr:META domain-containing protein [Candidatus Atribacteria bacterium]